MELSVQGLRAPALLKKSCLSSKESIGTHERGQWESFIRGGRPTLFLFVVLRRIGGLLPRCKPFEQRSTPPPPAPPAPPAPPPPPPPALPKLHSVPLPAAAPRPVSILKVDPRSVLESSQLRGQRQWTKRLHVPTYFCHGTITYFCHHQPSKLDVMVPRTLSKWLLVCHLNISQPALMSVLEISHHSTFTFLTTLLPDIKLFDIGHVFPKIASRHLYT